MNVIFAVIFLAAAIVFLVHDPEGFLPAMLAGGQKAATVCLALLASYCVWLGFFKVLEKSGLSERLARGLYPAARRLFRSQDRQALALACQNIAANLLGLPGAPTPPGVAATQKFLAAGNDYAADMLFVLNATSLQLLPTTVAGVRAACGCRTPFDILPAVWLSSAISVTAGLLTARLLSRVWRS